MARLRYNGVHADVSGTKTKLALGAALTNVATSVTFNGALKYAGGTAVPTIASPDTLTVTVLDAAGIVLDAFNVTAYTAGATTATIVRGVEGYTGLAHTSGATLVHGATTLDLAGVAGTTDYLIRQVPQIKSGTWIGTTESQYLGSRAIYNSSDAVGNYVEFIVGLNPGTWVCHLTYGIALDRGILALTVDGGSVGSIDAYSATTTSQADATTASFTVSSAGSHLFRIEVSGKNASASSYFAVLQRFAFERVS